MEVEEQFCKHHWKTLENPKGTDCVAHINEGRCFECPYTADNLRYGLIYGERPELYISQTESHLEGACPDFRPKRGMEQELIEIAKLNMAN